ncbi:hypothetical protein UlMin_001204 [Ulmus minor]
MLLIFFSGVGFCLDSSSILSKVVLSDPNIDSGNYIMKSYHEKHESLEDSDYQNFVARELSFHMCKVQTNYLNLEPKLSDLKRGLIGEGSHRHLSSSVRLSIQQKSISELSNHNCEVILVERLPSGVFADPFELQHLLQRGVFSDIAVFGDTNLELPSFLSNRSAVEVHMDVDLNTLKQKNEINLKVKLPLHARYAPLNESGYWQVRFGAPDLFLRCNVQGKSQNGSCIDMIATDYAKFENGPIIWNIPAGIKAHAGVVYVFTFVSAFLATLLIVVASTFSSSTNRSKSLKQS